MAAGLPLYRLSEILKRHQIELSRQTLSESVLTVGSKIEVLTQYLREQLLGSDLIYMDETRVQVLKEPGRSAQNHSYMWVQRGGPPDRPITLFHYDPSRSTETAEKLLEGFSGALMSDGYEPYQYLSWMLNQLPMTPIDEIESLMPWNIPEGIESPHGTAWEG